MPGARGGPQIRRCSVLALRALAFMRMGELAAARASGLSALQLAALLVTLAEKRRLWGLRTANEPPLNDLQQRGRFVVILGESLVENLRLWFSNGAKKTSKEMETSLIRTETARMHSLHN